MRRGITAGVVVGLVGLLVSANLAGARGVAAFRPEAKADAVGQVSAVSLPAGAREVRKGPARSLRRPPLYHVGGDRGQGRFVAIRPYVVDADRFWRAAQAPARVAAWVRSHPPSRAIGRPVGTRSGPARFTVAFFFQADPGRVVQRALVVRVIAARGGGSVVRGDGLAEWLPVHPSWDRVPHGIRFITARATTVNQFNGHRRPRSAGLTAARQVRRIVRAVNRAAALPPLPLPPCPFAGVSERLSLSFRARPRGPVLARATDWLGCAGGLVVWVGGRRGPVLWQPEILWKLFTRIEQRGHRHNR